MKGLLDMESSFGLLWVVGASKNICKPEDDIFLLCSCNAILGGILDKIDCKSISSIAGERLQWLVGWGGHGLLGYKWISRFQGQKSSHCSRDHRGVKEEELLKFSLAIIYIYSSLTWHIYKYRTQFIGVRHWERRIPFGNGIYPPIAYNIYYLDLSI